MFIRTVNGDIAPDRLGTCYSHEHIVIDSGFVAVKYPDFRLDDVDKIAAELRDFHAAGGRAMVDSMPMDAGRNAAKLAEVSSRAGVHIVCPTGVHLAKYYPADHWSLRLSSEELAELFVAEIERGIVDADHLNPAAGRTPHKAGVIKVAGGPDRLSDLEKKTFVAAAIAHRRTGAPILTHTERGSAAMEQAELLAGYGVDLRHVVLSHLDRNPDPAAHRAVLRTGVRIEYDSAFRRSPGSGNQTLKLLATLLPEFPDQIVLGMDAARRTYWKSFGGSPGLAFLLTTFTDQMKQAGISEDLLHRVFVTTPAFTYSFVKSDQKC